MKVGLKGPEIEWDLWITGFLMLLSIVLMVHASLYFTMNSYSLMSLTFLMWLLISGLFRRWYALRVNRLTMIRSTLIIVTTSVLLYEILKWTSQEQAIESVWYLYGRVKTFSIWALKYALGYAERTHDFKEIVLIMGLILLISASLYNFIHRQVKVRYLATGGVYFLVQWNRYVDSAMLYLVMFVMSLFLYHALIRHRQLGLQSFSVKANRRSLFLIGGTFVTAVALMAQGLTLIMPLDYLNQQLSDGIPNVLGLRDDYHYRASDQVFDFSNTIYQPQKNRLGGSIELKNDLVLLVESSQPGVYLRGSVKDIYDGERWLAAENQWEDFNPEFPSVTLISVKVNPMAFKMSTLLTPLNTFQIQKTTGQLFVNDEGIMVYKRAFWGKYLDSYDVKSALNPVYKPMDHQKLERYLQLPQSYSPKTVKLVQGIVKDQTKDLEKAEAIKRYLRDRYVYSLRVEDYGSQDFVEHFLFEGRSGYCTYFASSMVVMARIAGIPARYVEGYLLPEQRDRHGVYRVTADRAHAWPELFIEGVGWMTFEPTPAYGVEARMPYEEKAEPSDETQTSLSSVHDDESIRRAEAKGTLSKRWLILLVALLMMSVWMGIKRWQRKRHLKSKTEKERATERIYQIFKGVEQIDDALRSLKRPDLKLQGVLHKMEYDAQDESDIINAVYETLFSNKAMTRENVDQIERFEIDVARYLKKNMNRIHYLYIRYIR